LWVSPVVSLTEVFKHNHRFVESTEIGRLVRIFALFVATLSSTALAHVILPIANWIATLNARDRASLVLIGSTAVIIRKVRWDEPSEVIEHDLSNRLSDTSATRMALSFLIIESIGLRSCCRSATLSRLAEAEADSSSNRLSLANARAFVSSVSHFLYQTGWIG
jgi:hypothetical protein